MDNDNAAFRYQEVAFSLVMTLVAVVGRDNPDVASPGLLWAFAAMLAFNLGFQLLLKRLGRREGLALLSLLVNTSLIAWVLARSGGHESRFWPLYLLPIFTACLSLERRHVRLALAASAGYLCLFYLEALWRLSPWEVCELIIKLGVLALSAAVTSMLAFRERSQRAALQASREDVERLARVCGRERALAVENARRETLGSFIPGLVHDLNNPLAVILGSAELLLQEAAEGSLQRQDAQRIKDAARACARLAEDLRQYGRSRAAAP